jgi:hypothetical protein
MHGVCVYVVRSLRATADVFEGIRTIGTLAQRWMAACKKRPPSRVFSKIYSAHKTRKYLDVYFLRLKKNVIFIRFYTSLPPEN